MICIFLHGETEDTPQNLLIQIHLAWSFYVPDKTSIASSGVFKIRQWNIQNQTRLGTRKSEMLRNNQNFSVDVMKNLSLWQNLIQVLWGPKLTQFGDLSVGKRI